MQTSLEQRQKGRRRAAAQLNLERAERRLQVCCQIVDVEDAVQVERLQDTLDVAPRHEALVSSTQRRLDGLAHGGDATRQANSPGDLCTYLRTWNMGRSSHCFVSTIMSKS